MDRHLSSALTTKPGKIHSVARLPDDTRFPGQGWLPGFLDFLFPEIDGLSSFCAKLASHEIAQFLLSEYLTNKHKTKGVS